MQSWMMDSFLQTNIEKQNKCLNNDLTDANHRMEDLNSALADAGMYNCTCHMCNHSIATFATQKSCKCTNMRVSTVKTNQGTHMVQKIEVDIY